MKPADLQFIVTGHDKFWEDQRDELMRYKAVYEMDFWAESGDDKTQIRIQTNDGYGYIESFQSSLFAKNPSVVLKNGVRGKGDLDKASGVVNSFILKSRTQVEGASRLALIYPNAFLKMVPTGKEDIYDSVVPVAVPPWEIIVDRDAVRWDMQRFVGHIYWLPVPEANEKFGSNLEELGQDIEYFFEDEASEGNKSNPAKIKPDDNDFKYLKVIEIYDLQNDKMYWWNPARPDQWLDSADMIPFRDSVDEPITPIVPFFYNRIPDRPLVGYSAIKRIYDQLYEMNVIRSFQANAVRKASRQWLVKKGSVNSDEMARITSGVDGLFVEIESEDPLDSIIRPVPHQQVPIEVTRYMQEIQSDKDKGSVTAPFTRGEVTKATATEVAALAAYTTSEIGRMARERDAAIEQMGRVYLSMLRLFLQDEKKPTLILLDGRAQSVSGDDLKGDFEFFAADQASTPISEAIRQQRLLQNVPVLQALGVPNRKLLEEIVRAMNFPEDWLDSLPEEPHTGGVPSPSNPEEATTQDMINNPNPTNVTEQILGGGVGFTQ